MFVENDRQSIPYQSAPLPQSSRCDSILDLELDTLSESDSIPVYNVSSSANLAINMVKHHHAAFTSDTVPPGNNMDNDIESQTGFNGETQVVFGRQYREVDIQDYRILNVNSINHQDGEPPMYKSPPL